MTRTEEHTIVPDSVAVIPDLVAVIPDLIRDPVPHHHWIAGQARNDNGARNDQLGPQWQGGPQ